VALPLGHSNLPNLSLRFHTDSSLSGPTLNPWDRSLSPGGSSGGEGAALAADLTCLGLGHDAGGSVRLPALFAGAMALKPTTGRWASDRSTGPRNLSLASQLIPVDGVLARSVADLALVHPLLAGSDPRAPQADPAWPPRSGGPSKTPPGPWRRPATSSSRPTGPGPPTWGATWPRRP